MITAVPAVAPEGADTVTVLPEKATVARAGTEDETVNTLSSASAGAMFTVKVVLEPAAIVLVVGVTVTPVTGMPSSASVIWKVFPSPERRRELVAGCQRCADCQEEEELRGKHRR